MSGTCISARKYYFNHHYVLLQESSGFSLDDFEIMECIDEGLNLFGSNIRYTIYWRMTILNNIPREGILVNPEAFVRGIESIFGAGASRIEAAIVDKIKRRFNIQTFETTRFSDLIHQIRMQIAVA